jgi:hypothetical protein
MKILSLFIAYLSITITVCAQGKIRLQNNGLLNPDGLTYNARIADAAGRPLAGQAWTAELFHVDASGNLVALTPTTNFRVGGAAGYVAAVTVTVPGRPVGDDVTFKLRVWETSAGSWDEALIRGESNMFVVRLGRDSNGAGAPITPPPLDGMNPFNVYSVPEPNFLFAVTLFLGLLRFLRPPPAPARQGVPAQ